MENKKRRGGKGYQGGRAGEREAEDDGGKEASRGVRGEDRRRNRIRRARAVSSKNRARNERRQRETRNSKKTHIRGRGSSMTKTG